MLLGSYCSMMVAERSPEPYAAIAWAVQDPSALHHSLKLPLPIALSPKTRLVVIRLVRISGAGSTDGGAPTAVAKPYMAFDVSTELLESPKP